MIPFKTTKKQLASIIISGFFIAFTPIAMAEDADAGLEKIKIQLQSSSAIPFKGGTVTIFNNPNGPDRMVMRVRGMKPFQRTVLLLTQDKKPGGLPAQMLGEFTTNAKGVGILQIRTEVINAFASANQRQEDNLGIAISGQIPPAGLLPSLGGFANTIALNFFRGYVVNGAIDNVFGPDENTPGGSPVFESVSPLPNPPPIDPAPIILTESVPVPPFVNDATPNYTFSSNRVGIATYGGDCSPLDGKPTEVNVGENTVSFRFLGGEEKIQGRHSNCTITVTDTVGNASTLAITPFLVDTRHSGIHEVKPVITPSNDRTPTYTFSTTASTGSPSAGTVSFNGDCSSKTTIVNKGSNTVTFNPLAVGTHSNCTLTITDLAGNVSPPFKISPFTIDNETPTLTEVTPVPTPDNDGTPNYTFSSNRIGRVAYGGDCVSTNKVKAGNNTITFFFLADKEYTNCTITLTDTSGNLSNTLKVSPFTIKH